MECASHLRILKAAAGSAPYTDLYIGRLFSARPSRHARQSNPRVSAESARQQSPGREPREGTRRGISPARAMQDFGRDSTTCVALTGLSRFIVNPGFGRFAASPWAFLPRAFGAGLVNTLARRAFPRSDDAKYIDAEIRVRSRASCRTPGRPCAILGCCCGRN